MTLKTIINFQTDRIKNNPTQVDEEILRLLRIIKKTYTSHENSVLVEMPEADFPVWQEFKKYKQFKPNSHENDIDFFKRNSDNWLTIQRRAIGRNNRH